MTWQGANSEEREEYLRTSKEKTMRRQQQVLQEGSGKEKMRKKTTKELGVIQNDAMSLPTIEAIAMKI
jgi:hypothetical protein